MSFIARIREKARRLEAEYLARNAVRMKFDRPIISFTFDDFPENAYTAGGTILKKNRVLGTYYVSLGLLSRNFHVGQIAGLDILGNVLQGGHELGCHTYDHADAWRSSATDFEASIIKNRNELSCVFPGQAFSTFAYPIGNMTPKTKRIAQKYFLGSRGGGQDINENIVDLNNLSSFFLDWRTRDDHSSIARVIDRNSVKKGWLIFTTHDVDSQPSRYGCETNVFEEIVAYSLRSNALILPVREVVKKFHDI